MYTHTHTHTHTHTYPSMFVTNGSASSKAPAIRAIAAAHVLHSITVNEI